MKSTCSVHVAGASGTLSKITGAETFPKPYLQLYAMGKQPSYTILPLCLQARRIFTYTVVASIFHRMEMWMQFWTGLSASNRLKSARRPRRMYAARAFQVIAITSKTHAAYMWLGRLAHFKKLLALRPKPYLHLHAMGKQPSYTILTLSLQARRIFTYTVAASIFHRMEMWIQFWTGLSASNF